MREIKFRAWVKAKYMLSPKDKDTMFVGFSFEDITNGYEESSVFCENGEWEEPKWEKAIIMQYTGLKDKNGKEIYEGDIFNAVDNKGQIVSPKNIVELADFLGGHYWNVNHRNSIEYEVIGNIYENPELIK